MTVANSATTNDPATLGVLVINDKAVRHVVEGAMADCPVDVRDLQVRVASLSDDGVELDLSLGLAYPTDSLSEVLTKVREQVASETSRQLGRPVRRLDLTITGFHTGQPAPRPRVI